GRSFLKRQRSVELMATFKSRPQVENTQVVLHFLVFIGLAFLIFSNNSSCIFFGLDGAYLAITRELQAIARTPFTQVGAHPFDGNFDDCRALVPEYLLPNLMAMPFGDGNPGKAITYTIYAGLMVLSVYVLGRAVRVDRAPALFAGLLYPVPTLPMFIGSFPAFYSVYGAAPELTQVASLTSLALACFWALEEKSFFRSLFLALAELCCIIWIAFSSSQLIVLSIPPLLFFGVASLLSARRWQLDIPRVITGIVIF